MRFVARHLKRIIIGVFLVALAFLLSIPVTFISMIAKFKRSLGRGLPSGPLLQPRARSALNMDEIMGHLFEIPFRPVRPRVLGYAKGALSNSYPSVLNAVSRASGLVYPYPREFDKVTIRSFDGAELAAVVGLHRDGKPRPGIVICHGYMGSKNDHYLISTALTAYSEWGFNVMAPDLRDFGRSQSIGFHPTTLGWKEGEDLLAAAKHLGDLPEVTSVGVTGFSMGAMSTMRAAYMAREYPYLTGGAIAWNGVSDGHRIVPHLDQRRPVTDEFFIFYYNFRLSHLLRRWDMKRHIADPEVRDFLEEPFSNYNFASYLGRVSAPHYGVSYDELVTQGSSKDYLGDLEVPLLVIHSADDPICPVSEMEDLIEISERNPNLKVWILPTGSHCVFPYLDRSWFDTVMRSFFEYWAKWE